jgi:hypothetical protein
MLFDTGRVDLKPARNPQSMDAAWKRSGRWQGRIIFCKETAEPDFVTMVMLIR